MTPQEFCYWLQGFVELDGGHNIALSQQQWQEIKNHLKLVFDKRTPDISHPKVSTLQPPTYCAPAPMDCGTSVKPGPFSEETLIC